MIKEFFLVSDEIRHPSYCTWPTGCEWDIIKLYSSIFTSDGQVGTTKPHADTHVVGPYLQMQANRIHAVDTFFSLLNFEAKAQQLSAWFCCRVLSRGLHAQLVPLYYRSSLLTDALISIDQAAIHAVSGDFFHPNSPPPWDPDACDRQQDRMWRQLGRAAAAAICPLSHKLSH